jgi:hypothetical protein
VVVIMGLVDETVVVGITGRKVGSVGGVGGGVFEAISDGAITDDRYGTSRYPNAPMHDLVKAAELCCSADFESQRPAVRHPDIGWSDDMHARSRLLRLIKSNATDRFPRHMSVCICMHALMNGVLN